MQARRTLIGTRPRSGKKRKDRREDVDRVAAAYTYDEKKHYETRVDYRLADEPTAARAEAALEAAAWYAAYSAAQASSGSRPSVIARP